MPLPEKSLAVLRLFKGELEAVERQDGFLRVRLSQRYHLDPREFELRVLISRTGDLVFLPQAIALSEGTKPRIKHVRDDGYSHEARVHEVRWWRNATRLIEASLPQQQ